jgi:hypothetical protein
VLALLAQLAPDKGETSEVDRPAGGDARVDPPRRQFRPQPQAAEPDQPAVCLAEACAHLLVVRPAKSS